MQGNITDGQIQDGAVPDNHPPPTVHLYQAAPPVFGTLEPVRSGPHFIPPPTYASHDDFPEDEGSEDSEDTILGHPAPTLMSISEYVRLQHGAPPDSNPLYIGIHAENPRFKVQSGLSAPLGIISENSGLITITPFPHDQMAKGMILPSTLNMDAPEFRPSVQLPPGQMMDSRTLPARMMNAPEFIPGVQFSSGRMADMRAVPLMVVNYPPTIGPSASFPAGQVMGIMEPPLRRDNNTSVYRPGAPSTSIQMMRNIEPPSRLDNDTPVYKPSTSSTPVKAADTSGLGVSERGVQPGKKEFRIFEDIPPPNFSHIKPSRPHSRRKQGDSFLYNLTDTTSSQIPLKRALGTQPGVPASQHPYIQQYHQQGQQTRTPLQDRQHLGELKTHQNQQDIRDPRYLQEQVQDQQHRQGQKSQPQQPFLQNLQYQQNQRSMSQQHLNQQKNQYQQQPQFQQLNQHPSQQQPQQGHQLQQGHRAQKEHRPQQEHQYQQQMPQNNQKESQKKPAREMEQHVHAKPFRPKSEVKEVPVVEEEADDTNDALIDINDCIEQHPPRICPIDVDKTIKPSPTATLPTISEERPNEKEKTGEGSDEEDSEDEEERRNITPALSFILLSMISRTPTHPAYVAHCPHLLEGRCASVSKNGKFCRDKLHFRRIVHSQTDVRLGDCSFLDSCDMADRCPYIHYQPLFSKRIMKKIQSLNKEELKKHGIGDEDAKEPDDEEGEPENAPQTKRDIEFPPSESGPPQWIRCDITRFDLEILGKFKVIMADPPWDIRMTLPYGTVPDQAIIDLPFGVLQDEGLFFLWCTARTIDAGHACLRAWGYRFCDEIAWVKVDHLNRLISVGRTGHWLNHTMEHCLVGIKGNPTWINRGRNMDVIVAQPRATSHKPDEIYELIDSLVGPEARKLELFGREHNIRKGWLTLGNQLPHSHIYEKPLKFAYMNFLNRAGQPYTYNASWNPWANGFDRYGYGTANDWREERRIGVQKSRAQVGNTRGRGGSVRGASNVMVAQPRPGFRKDFQGIERGQQGESSNSNINSPQSYQKQAGGRKYQNGSQQQKFSRCGNNRGGYQQRGQSNVLGNNQKVFVQGNQKDETEGAEGGDTTQRATGWEIRVEGDDGEELVEQFTSLDFI